MFGKHMFRSYVSKQLDMSDTKHSCPFLEPYFVTLSIMKNVMERACTNDNFETSLWWFELVRRL